MLESVTDAMIIDATVPGASVRFYAPTTQLITRAQTLLRKEPDTIAWIDQFDEGDVLWDIGANVGVFGLYAAVRKQCKVLAFEPSAANYYVLSRNIELNHLADRMTAYCIAFADETRAGVLNLASHSLGTSLNQFGELGETSRYWSQSTPAVVQGMIGFSIDDFMHQFNPPFPTHIKIDVDGIESAILRGARRTLSDPRLRSVLVELDVDSPEEGSDGRLCLEEAGFRLAGRGELQGTESAHAANHLFERIARPTAKQPIGNT